MQSNLSFQSQATQLGRLSNRNVDACKGIYPNQEFEAFFISLRRNFTKFIRIFVDRHVDRVEFAVGMLLCFPPFKMVDAVSRKVT